MAKKELDAIINAACYYDLDTYLIASSQKDSNMRSEKVDVTFSASTGLTDVGTNNSGSTLKSSLSGAFSNQNAALDFQNGQSGPWYTQNPLPNGQDTIFSNASPNRAADTIGANDSPAESVPLTDQNAKNLISSLQIQFSFELDISAETKDTSNNANSQYFRCATAAWSFVGDGTVNIANGAYTSAANAGIFSPAAWSSTTGASQPPQLDPHTQMNQQIKGQTFGP